MILFILSKFRLERFVFKLDVLDFGLQDMFRFDVASNLSIFKKGIFEEKNKNRWIFFRDINP
jgi:hypothetical protein